MSKVPAVSGSFQSKLKPMTSVKSAVAIEEETTTLSAAQSNAMAVRFSNLGI
jgi:hypothetical protein